MDVQDIVRACPELAEIVGRADRAHVKSVDCRKSLREFTAAVLSYMPGWMRFLYRVRAVFVRLLANRQDGIPEQESIAPEALPFAPGEKASIFTVVAAEEDRFWTGEARDKMIAACLAVVVQPLGDGRNRFHILTTATYLRWTGRIYFNVITPFHHLVVTSMARQGARP